ncbi:SDR family oxidoreductase [Aliikangiella coralliicola]|uniref:SDR family oxidoreductase n=1 Tax=Aliikangiella coralliicola TaxID=2592383 RepID=A0A545UAH9_9GAMM|nr:SDR family oxidoreductase [Aliikangiella coralliicola]TQV86476.1 SDR family oxidoreductase [Aliikangiella coralliicola]
MTIEINKIIAFTTGANRGVGKAITEGLLEAGAKKVYTAVRNLESVAALQEKYGDRIVPVEFELSRKDTIDNAIKIATDVNMVVSNAGVVQLSSPLDDNAIEGLKYQMEGNVYPLIRLAQAFGPILKNNGGGAFVQMNSLASIKNFLPFTGYSASKAAAYSVTQGLREAWAAQGTQVISVIAGPLKTDMADSAGMGEGAPPPSLVADGILAALKSNDFFVYPDPMAQEVAKVYSPYAKNVLEIAH